MDRNREVVVLPRPGEAPADARRGSVYFVGTATVVIRYAGFTILTDPNFLHARDHVHLGYGLTSPRLTNPAVDLGDLPPLDLVILSHMHGDHFDRIAAERLDRALPILTTAHAARKLRDMGFENLHALETWEAVDVLKGAARLRVTAMPAKHAPGILRPLLPAVMGSLLEFQPEADRTAYRIYISGDTLLHDDLAEIPIRFPKADLALLHLGGTRLFGVLLTMDAKQGVEAIRVVDPRLAIPIHFNDSPVFQSTLGEFIVAVRAAGLEGRVRYLGHGDTYGFDVERPPAPQRAVPRRESERRACPDRGPGVPG